MRARKSIVAGVLIALLMIAGLAFDGRGASARLQEATPQADATPEADTGEAETTPEPTLTGIVTLVSWYVADESGEFLAIGPVRTNNALVAGPDDDNERALSGRVDFDDPDNDDLPRITLGESVFDAYPVYEGDADSTFRWIYTNDDPSVRPATLVLQVNAVDGPYDGYSGTATFISRSVDPASGVIVFVLTPPVD